MKALNCCMENEAMKEYTLDGRRMDTRAAAFLHIKQELGLPEYFGNNLDALADCLSELRAASVILRYTNAMINALGVYGQKMIGVFEMEAAARQDFIFRQNKS